MKYTMGWMIEVRSISRWRAETTELGHSLRRDCRSGNAPRWWAAHHHLTAVILVEGKRRQPA